jgi:NAD(P)-dependent dehydrogenase (short-subunit alcohol dehydrogenase family)
VAAVRAPNRINLQFHRKDRGGELPMSKQPIYNFAGKVVTITGGSRGLGHAMAIGFARAGAKVAIASRKIEACESTVQEIRALGGDGSAHGVHVGLWRDCDRLADEVYARWGRCDVLVNNAGMSPLYPSLAEHTEELFDKVVGVNLKGPFRLSALFGSRMASGDGGAIINVSSTAAIRPSKTTTPYSAAKAGLNAITIAFAQEYGPKVRVNCIMAGPFLTDVSKVWAHTEEFKNRSQTFPMRRAGDADEVVGAALYLASDAASFTTGAILTIDGGASIPTSD